MATLAQLRTRIAEHVYDAPAHVNNAKIDEWINRAIKKLQERRNYRVQRATSEFNTVVGNRILAAVPGDWKEPRTDTSPYYRRQLGDTTQMQWGGSEQDVRREFTFNEADDKGAPQWLWVGLPLAGDLGAANIEVYPFPDGLSDWTSAPVGEYRVLVPYWKYLPVLSSDGASNWFSVNAEDFIEFYGQWRAFRATWDQTRTNECLQLMRNEERDVWRKNVMEELQGMTTLEPRTDVRGRRNMSRM